jgi:hypothetical protein
MGKVFSMSSDHGKILMILLATCCIVLGESSTRVVLPFKGRPVPNTGATGPDRTEIRFENHRDHPVKIFWITNTGDRIAYGQLAPGAFKTQRTYPGHVWMITDKAGYPLGHFIGLKTPGIARIGRN